MGRGEVIEMKHFFLLGTIIALVLMNLNYTGETKEKQQATPLAEIVELMETNDIGLTEWKLYTRGEFQKVRSKSEYKQLLKQFMEHYDNFSWEQKEGDPHWKVFGSNVHNALPFAEDLTILAYPQGSYYHVYLVYEIQGKSWNVEKWAQISPIFQERIDELFPTPTPVFTTVRGVSDSIGKSDLYETAKAYLEQLNAETIEGLKEETFVSLSAYNAKWNGSITTNGQQMNLQAALRQSSRLGGETTVTIGTPIITTEY